MSCLENKIFLQWKNLDVRMLLVLSTWLLDFDGSKSLEKMRWYSLEVFFGR